MQEIKRRYVIPGDKIVEGNYKPLMNVIKSGDFLISTRIGIAEAGKDGVKVIPLSGVYIPRVNDLVIGKVIDRSSLSWDIDINSCFFAHLPAQDVFGRDFSPARDDMGRQLNIGDLIIARIVSFDRTRDPMLTVQDKDLGKIPYGEFIKISPTRVPRLIGKRGSMIQTIEQATQTRVIIGQNGIVVVTGRDNEGLSLAVKAIKMVEEESHTTNLTQRVKSLLNVQDPTDSQSENIVGTSSNTDNTTSASPLSDSQMSRSSNSGAQLNSHTLGRPSSLAEQPQQETQQPPISTTTPSPSPQQETQQPPTTMETQISSSSINSSNRIAEKQPDNNINMTNNDQKEKKQEGNSEGVQ
jgi:exosome complex component RRP4